MAASIYTTSNTTGIGTISGGTIVATNTSGAMYDPYRETIHGVPIYDWQRMSASEQRYYAEREYMRQQSMKMAMPPDIAEPKKVAVKTDPEPAFLNNKTLLLLEI